ncbi:MAG: hypothetical protein M3Q48_11845 [Actinomycetota bacterium]|nr:hypothetical protein [Actinomycetota bacterium]
MTVATFLGLDFETLDPEGLTDTVALAGPLESAEAVLADPTGVALAALATSDIHVRPHPLPSRWRSASPSLISRVLAIRDPRLRPVDRLRWRTTTAGRVPARRDDLDPGAVPDALWPDWAVRLCPPTGVDATSFRLVAAAALTLPGSCRALNDLARGRGEHDVAFGRKLSHVLQAVARSDHGRSVLRALTQLSDGLRTHRTPIDYERRRRIAAIPVLDLKAWDEICAAAVPTGGRRKLRNARLWVWELLTRGLPQHAPEPLRPMGPGGSSEYHAFALHLPAVAAGLLEAHARKVLDDHGCDREPPVWSPPTDWVDLDGVPVPDLDSTDIARAAALWRRNRPPSAVADELGLTLDHVRLVLRRQPVLFPPRHRPRRDPPPRRTAPAVRSGAPRPRKARTVPPPDLTPERLRVLVVDEKRTLRSLADEFRVGRKYLAERLRREGMPVPPSRRRPTHVVDREWLRVEYLERRRTLPDIAAEVGTTPPNIARIAPRPRHPSPRPGRTEPRR